MSERVLDVFVTKDSSTYDNTYDDEFVGPVWSVEFGSASPGASEDLNTAIVVNKPSQWVTWCAQTSADLEVGDMVRIGSINTDGHTDYCTVLEKRKITTLKSGVFLEGTTTGSTQTGIEVKYTYFDSNGNAAYQILSAPTASTSTYGVTPGGATPVVRTVDTYAYRLNFNVNCTLPTDSYDSYWQSKNPRETQLLQTRELLKHSAGVVANKSDHLRRMFYPLFRSKKWLTNTGEVQIKLDHGVKDIHWLKLVGYSVFNKRQPGFQVAHEFTQDDWIALHIKEINGKVVSNNRAAASAFCVLHTGSSNDSTTGAIEFHQFDPAGLHTHYFDSTRATVHDLTFKFLDRNGNTANFGRIHLWFKVCVRHG